MDAVAVIKGMFPYAHAWAQDHGGHAEAFRWDSLAIEVYLPDQLGVERTITVSFWGYLRGDGTAHLESTDLAFAAMAWKDVPKPLLVGKSPASLRHWNDVRLKDIDISAVTEEAVIEQLNKALALLDRWIADGDLPKTQEVPRFPQRTV